MIIINFFVLPQPVETASDLVDARYVAERLGLKSHRTVLQGKGGAGAIPRAQARPPRWRRSDVEAYLESLAEVKTPEQRALTLLEGKRFSGKRLSGRTKGKS